MGFVFEPLPSGGIPPLGNLWFITVILMCYVITILLKKFENKYSFSKLVVVLIISCLYLIPVIFAFLGLPNISLGYFAVYLIGYFLSKQNYKANVLSFCVFGFIMMISSVIIRLLLKQLLDTSFPNLYLATTAITHSMLAISTYFLVDYLTDKIVLLQRLAQTQFWLTLDKYSYVVYITHYAFTNSVTSVDKFGLSKPISIVIFILLTIISSIVIYKINEFIQKKLVHKGIT